MYALMDTGIMFVVALYTYVTKQYTSCIILRKGKIELTLMHLLF